jgi:hypothetical protein
MPLLPHLEQVLQPESQVGVVAEVAGQTLQQGVQGAADRPPRGRRLGLLGLPLHFKLAPGRHEAVEQHGDADLEQRPVDHDNVAADEKHRAQVDVPIAQARLYVLRAG